MHSISIVTFNTRGLRARGKRRAIFRHLHVNYPNSIICLQETHSSDSDENMWQMEWGGDVLFSHGSETMSGVAFLFPRNNCHSIEQVMRDDAGRLLITDLKCSMCEITLVGVYAPSVHNQDEKCRFLEYLKGTYKRQADTSHDYMWRHEHKTGRK